MPSPFPGMNPYLEQESLWLDFHQAFITGARASLTAQVSPNYVVRIEAHVFLHELPESAGALAGRGDLLVSRHPHGVLSSPSAQAVAIPSQVVIPYPVVDEERVSYLEILDRSGWQVITVIELLSRSNKYSSPDRAQYLAKRNRLLASSAHLVEIDLLRGGPRLPIENLPACDYYAMVSRSENRPKADLWPIQMRESPPKIPIPLRRGDADALLDLRAILHNVYDDAGYESYIYRSQPIPKLDWQETEWAKQFLPEQS